MMDKENHPTQVFLNCDKSERRYSLASHQKQDSKIPLQNGNHLPSKNHSHRYSSSYQSNHTHRQRDSNHFAAALTSSQILITKEYNRLNVSELTSQAIQNYGMEIIQKVHDLQFRSTPKDFLERHDITPLFRAKMINWMIEVCSIFGKSRSTFFISVAFMDNYFAKCPSCLASHDLHLIGVTCMYMAAKLEDIFPFKNHEILAKIAHNAFSLKKIRIKELAICKALEFHLILTTPYEYLEHYLEQLKFYFKGMLSLGDLKLMESLTMVSTKLCMMCMYDYTILNTFSQSTIAAGCIFLGALSLSMANRDQEDKLAYWVKSLAGPEKENFHEMEECARFIQELKSSFDLMYPNLKNYSVMKFKPVDAFAYSYLM